MSEEQIQDSKTPVDIQSPEPNQKKTKPGLIVLGVILLFASFMNGCGMAGDWSDPYQQGQNTAAIV